MSTHDVVEKVQRLIIKGLLAVGCTVPVEGDDDTVIIRDLVIFHEDNFLICVEATRPDTVLMQFPDTAYQNAASTIACRVAEGIITRAIEREA